MELRKNDRPNIDTATPWTADKLNRRHIAEYLTPVIASISQPFVIGLNSPFGTGKSLFLECWKTDLSNQGYPTVLFNAWETDFSHDALLAFISAVQRGLENNKNIKIPAKAKKKLDGLAKAAGGFMRHELLPMAARVAVRKIMGDDEAKNLIESFSAKSEEIENLASELTKEGLRSQRAAEDALNEFKSYLNDTISEIVKNIGSPEKQKLIVFRR